jgi:hypothetical protein
MAKTNGTFEHLAGLAEDLRLENLRPQLAACRRQVQADGGVEVAVFG